MSNPIEGIPSNQIWDKGQAPVERLEILKKQVSSSQESILATLHKDQVSQAEIDDTMKLMSAFKQAIKNTQPEFPPLPPGHFPIHDPEFDLDVYYQEQPQADDSYNLARSSINNLTDKVAFSLNKPGSIDNETDGWLVSQPMEKAVKELFSRAGNGLNSLYDLAKGVRTDGLHLEEHWHHNPFPHPPVEPPLPPRP